MNPGGTMKFMPRRFAAAVAVAVVLALAPGANADSGECAELRRAITDIGDKIEAIEHDLAVSDMTYEGFVDTLLARNGLLKELIERLVRYGRRGCDWEAIDERPVHRLGEEQ